jgi:hypothetical protein
LSIVTSASPVTASAPACAPGVAERLLVGALAEGDPAGRRHAGFVHHDEHVLEAAVRLAEQVADGAALVAEGHDAGRAGVDAELVLDRHAVGVVALAERTVGIDQELRHQEQRDALHAGRGVRQAGEDEMDDVVRHVVVAIGDEDLLAEDAVAAVGLRLGAAADQGQIGTGFGSVRFIVPVHSPEIIFSR